MHIDFTFVHACVTQAPPCRRSELRAAAGKGLARVEAENEWLQLHAELGVPVHVFRLGGARTALLGQCRTAATCMHPSHAQAQS
jgi:hypothetical protein